MADVESFAERMFPHAPTCLIRHCCVNHRAWSVMLLQPMDDAKNLFLITEGVDMKTVGWIFFSFANAYMHQERAHVNRKTYRNLLWHMQTYVQAFCDSGVLSFSDYPACRAADIQVVLSRFDRTQCI